MATVASRGSAESKIPRTSLGLSEHRYRGQEVYTKKCRAAMSHSLRFWQRDQSVTTGQTAKDLLPRTRFRSQEEKIQDACFCRVAECSDLHDEFSRRCHHSQALSFQQRPGQGLPRLLELLVKSAAALQKVESATAICAGVHTLLGALILIGQQQLRHRRGRGLERPSCYQGYLVQPAAKPGDFRQLPHIKPHQGKARTC